MIILNDGLGAVTDGALEFDSSGLYVTRKNSRKLMPTPYSYVQTTRFTGQNATGVQPVFPKNFVIEGNKLYRYELQVMLDKSTGTTSHIVSTGFGGTCTISKNFRTVLGYRTVGIALNDSYSEAATNARVFNLFYNTTTMRPLAAAAGVALSRFMYRETGFLDITADGTIIPQYELSAAPGAAYATRELSYFTLYPVAPASVRTLGPVQ